MDAINDYYMEELDLSAMKRFFLEQRGEAGVGESRIILCGKANGRGVWPVWEDGMFRFVRTDTKGGEHVVV